MAVQKAFEFIYLAKDLEGVDVQEAVRRACVRTASENTIRKCALLSCGFQMHSPEHGHFEDRATFKTELLYDICSITDA
jgi:hypothetical protein